MKKRRVLFCLQGLLYHSAMVSGHARTNQFLFVGRLIITLLFTPEPGNVVYFLLLFSYTILFNKALSSVLTI